MGRRRRMKETARPEPEPEPEPASATALASPASAPDPPYEPKGGALRASAAAAAAEQEAELAEETTAPAQTLHESNQEDARASRRKDATSSGPVEIAKAVEKVLPILHHDSCAQSLSEGALAGAGEGEGEGDLTLGIGARDANTNTNTNTNTYEQGQAQVSSVVVPPPGSGSASRLALEAVQEQKEQEKEQEKEVKVKRGRGWPKGKKRGPKAKKAKKEKTSTIATTKRSTSSEISEEMNDLKGQEKRKTKGGRKRKIETQAIEMLNGQDRGMGVTSTSTSSEKGDPQKIHSRQTKAKAKAKGEGKGKGKGKKKAAVQQVQQVQDQLQMRPPLMGVNGHCVVTNEQEEAVETPQRPVLPVLPEHQLHHSFVGERIETWYADQKEWFPGTIVSFNEEKGAHFIHYDDGDKEELLYDSHKHDFRDEQGEKVDIRWLLDPNLRGKKWAEVRDCDSPERLRLHKGVLTNSEVVHFRWISQKQPHESLEEDSIKKKKKMMMMKKKKKDGRKPALEPTPTSSVAKADLHVNNNGLIPEPKQRVADPETLILAKEAKGVEKQIQREEGSQLQDPSSSAAQFCADVPGEKNVTKTHQIKSSFIGKKIETWYADQKEWFPGTIVSFNEEKGTHFVHYDDGDKEELFYDDCKHEFRDEQGEKPDIRWLLDPRLKKNRWIEVRSKDSPEFLMALIHKLNKKSGLAEVSYEHDGHVDLVDLRSVDVNYRIVDRRGLATKTKDSGINKGANERVQFHVDTALLNRRIEVRFDDPPEYFPGILDSFNEKTGRYRISYDDGSTDHLLYNGGDHNEFRDDQGEILKYRWELDPRLRKNKWIEVCWIDEGTKQPVYYFAQIKTFDRKSGNAEIEYEQDAFVEVVDLSSCDLKYTISDRVGKPRIVDSCSKVKKETDSTENLKASSATTMKQTPKKSITGRRDSAEDLPTFIPLPNDIVWVRQQNFGYWPAEVLDPETLGEEQMKERIAKFANNQICALFFDGSSRSFCWAPLKDVLPFEKHYEKLSKKNKKNKVFSLGVEQARQECQEKREAEARLKKKSGVPHASNKRAKTVPSKSPKKGEANTPEKNQKKRKFMNLNSSSTDEELSMALIKKLSHGLRAQKTEQAGVKPPKSTSVQVQMRDPEPPKEEVFKELPLDQFETDDVVWAQTKGCPFWPAVIFAYELLPPQVRNLRKNDTLPVMYLGPCSKSKKGQGKNEGRDWGWVGQGSILPFTENLEAFRSQRVTKAHKMADYNLAIEEAEKWQRGELLEGMAWEEVPSVPEAGLASTISKEKSGPQCKSCGSMVKDGKFLQTRNWTELCKPCKRAYDNGDFCKVCEALYLPTEKDMVCCDSCNGWIHGKCDPEARKVLQQVSQNPEGDVSYLCILCREIFSKQGLERKPGTTRLILEQKEKDSLLDQAKQLFAVDFLNDARRKKSWIRSVKEEAMAVNTAWSQLTADNQQEYIARVTPAKPANKRKPVAKDKSAAGHQGNLNTKDTAVVAKARKAPDGPWNKVQHKKFAPVKVRWAKDYCSICDLAHDYEFDQFLTCTSCGITVHQSCYGVKELPALDDVWLCRACEKHEKGKKRPQCCVCPVEGGALKPTTLAGYWCHVACMQWLPEITVVDVDRMEPIDRITKINKQRWDKRCSLCKQEMGAIIQCDSCYTAFHPLCARMAGCEMVTEEDKNGNIHFKAFCPKHSSKLNLGRTGLVSATSEVEVEGEKRLVDPSQYVLHVTLPPLNIQCTAGCGRCEPLHSSLGWQRENKGNGRGISSTKGFWIPEPLEPLPLIVEENSKSKTKKTPVKAVSRKRNGQPAMYSRYWPKSPIPLEPLPEGCPERVRASCGNLHGFFTVRSQTILYQNQEIAASKFEALGGRGTSKKWKLSVWACDDNGSAVMQMSDWLNEYGLSKERLFSLKMNAIKREKYAEWKNSQANSEKTEVETVVARVINEVMLNCSTTFPNGKVVRKEDDQKVPCVDPKGSSPSTEATPMEADLSQVVCQEQNHPTKKDTMKGSDPALGNDKSSQKVVKEVVSEVFENILNSEKKTLARNRFGAAAVGEVVRIFLSEVNTWCVARILRYSEKHGMHKIEYRFGSTEWLSLLFHERITWDNKLSGPPQAASSQDGGPFVQKSLSDWVGKRIGIWWKDDCCFYYGQIRDYNATDANGKCWQIIYDDGVEEWLDLKQERVDWTDKASGLIGLSQTPFVAVICNGLKGYFMTASNQIHVFGICIPLETFVEFAGLRGKGSSWKLVIRILKKDNSPGQTIGDWLFEYGQEPKSYSPSSFQKENKMKRKNQEGRRVRVDVKRQRCGKQAFVRGLAYRVKFSRKREEVPDYKSWSGKDWLAKFKANDSPFPSAVDHAAMEEEEDREALACESGDESVTATDPSVVSVMDAILKMVEEQVKQSSSAPENPNKPESNCIEEGPEEISSSLMNEVVALTESRADMGLISSTGLLGQVVQLNEHVADGAKVTGRVVGLEESALKIDRMGTVIDVPFGDELIWWHTLMNVDRTPKHVKQFIKTSDQATTSSSQSSNAYPMALGAYCVGWRVSLLWPDNNMYYYGVVDDYNYLDSTHRILYDDGNYEWLNLDQEEIKWLKRPGESKKRKEHIPDEVRVSSNGVEGVFHVHIRKIAVPEKLLKIMRFVSKTTFASNKAKNMKIQELMEQGTFEESSTPKSNRLREKVEGKPKSEVNEASDEEKEIETYVRNMVRLALEKASGEVNTTCLAAEAAEAAEAVEAAGGTGSGPSEPQPTEHQMNETGNGNGGHGRDGLVDHNNAEEEEPVTLLPIEEFEWLARKFHPSSKITKAKVFNDDGSIGNYTLLQWLRLQGLEAPPKAKKSVKAEGGAGGSGQKEKEKKKKKKKKKKVRFAEPEEPEGFDVIPLIDQIKKCAQEEYKKVTFGKSVIHGWGLFAKVAIKEGETVVEYRGDIVRHSVANEREIRYREQKKDLYLFTANDHQVIDSTDCGSIGRFMNHSCAPSMYIKFAEDSATGLPHLVFLARCDILPGQELTFDYRLKEEDDDNKIQCTCGAPTCKGTMN